MCEMVSLQWQGLLILQSITQAKMLFLPSGSLTLWPFITAMPISTSWSSALQISICVYPCGTSSNWSYFLFLKHLTPKVTKVSAKKKDQGLFINIEMTQNAKTNTNCRRNSFWHESKKICDACQHVQNSPPIYYSGIRGCQGVAMQL